MRDAEPPPPPSVSAGDVLRTVVFGPVLGGHVRLWQDEGPATYWRVRDPETFRRQVGIGTCVRSMVDTNRYREAGLFDAATGTLLLPGRYGDPDQGMPAGVAELTPVAAEVALSAITEQVRQDFARWFGAAAVSAAQRGEFVALETGGFTVPMTPYVLALVVRAPDGSWVSRVETRPLAAHPSGGTNRRTRTASNCVRLPGGTP